MDWHDGYAAALREIGGTASELLTPPVSTTPSLGKDHETPARVKQLGRDVGALAIDPRSFDGNCSEHERREHRLPRPVEEVVRGGGDHTLIAKSLRQRRENDPRIEGAGVVRGEDHGPVKRTKMLSTVDRRPSDKACQRHCSPDLEASPKGTSCWPSSPLGVVDDSEI